MCPILLPIFSIPAWLWLNFHLIYWIRRGSNSQHFDCEPWLLPTRPEWHLFFYCIMCGLVLLRAIEKWTKVLLEHSKLSGKSNHEEKAKMPSSNPRKGLEKYSFISSFSLDKLNCWVERNDQYSTARCLIGSRIIESAAFCNISVPLYLNCTKTAA